MILSRYITIRLLPLPECEFRFVLHLQQQSFVFAGVLSRYVLYVVKDSVRGQLSSLRVSKCLSGQQRPPSWESDAHDTVACTLLPFSLVMFICLPSGDNAVRPLNRSSK